MGRGKEPEIPTSDPIEAKKHRDESSGHLKNGYYQRALNSLNKIIPSLKAKTAIRARFWLPHGPLASGEVGAKTHSVAMATTALGVNTIASPHTPRYVRKMDSADKAKALARSILGPAKDDEFLASFVRVGIADEEEEVAAPKASISKRAPQTADKRHEAVVEEKKSAKERKASPKPKKKSGKRKKRERRKREEELYTDKDRAAAVVMGSKDIKQSLNMLDKAEKSSALQLPEEADSGALLALARAEMTRERFRTAINFVNKAIELAPEEKAAYVARSKCHLLLGEPRSALADAETALALDPKHGKALLHKAEALYYCGEFEMSLVHYHRGLRARPDLNEFRLGVQKAQEAIENTIGAVKPVKKPTKRARSKSARPVLGQLMSDKLYLENLLKNPDLAIADRKNDIVTQQAEEALRFLENREEFWRQQQTL